MAFGQTPVEQIPVGPTPVEQMPENHGEQSKRQVLPVVAGPSDTQRTAKNNQTISLLTPWGKEVNAQNVHTDYPRPTMVREEWLNLNGLWEWNEQFGNESCLTVSSFGENPATKIPIVSDAIYKNRILVPFPIESHLSGIGNAANRTTNSVEQSEYRRFFTIPSNWRDQRVLLHFGAVDWEATVFINGKLVGTHRGGYDPFSFEVTSFIHPDLNQPNELIVRVTDPTNRGMQMRGKQLITPSGIWYSPVSGIWQTVWLEPVPKSFIRSIRYSTDIHAGTLTLFPEVSFGTSGQPNSSNAFLFVEAFDGDEVIAKGYGGSLGPILLQFSKHKLKAWSPDSPHLYQIRVRLLENDKQVDQVGSYVAFRQVDIIQDEKGHSLIRLNGDPLFQMGVIDSGYWPDGLYTPPSDAAIQSDIQVAKSLGFNVIRKHLKIESERWYYWADRLGILVWQDIPCGDNRTIESQQEFQNDLKRLISARRHHPSIIVWTLFNEGHGQHNNVELVDLMRKWDATRLINNASGWNDFKLGDLNDAHRFPGPEMPFFDSNRASVIGSFGGITLVPPSSHLWTQETWGFQHVADSESLVRRYRKLHEELRKQIHDEGLSGAIFHQLVDVESECNGLVSYDRMILKVPPEEISQINQETIHSME
ncbi:MAG: glycoside hydrolase family 2 protein [Thermoguttaceae bacterium]